jgi:hypothetical protein
MFTLNMSQLLRSVYCELLVQSAENKDNEEVTSISVHRFRSYQLRPILNSVRGNSNLVSIRRIQAFSHENKQNLIIFLSISGKFGLIKASHSPRR